MQSTSQNDFILIGSEAEGGTVYVCEPGPDRNTWTAYDIRPGGTRTNPRVVFGKDSSHWRGLLELE
jgi:hypothetical protein